MTRFYLSGWLILIGLAPVMAQPIASMPKQAAALSYPCLGCHSSVRVDTHAIPLINGMNKHQFVRIMTAFQTGTKPATVMGRIAKAYTQTDFIKMAWFFARQPIHNPTKD